MIVNLNPSSTIEASSLLPLLFTEPLASQKELCSAGDCSSKCGSLSVKARSFSVSLRKSFIPFLLLIGPVQTLSDETSCKNAGSCAGFL